MRAAPTFVIGFALAACGTTVSPSYGRPIEAGVADSGVATSIDVTTPDEGVIVARDVVHEDAGHGPPYPIILHHGFAGFQSIGPINYFYNVADDLRSRGEVVYEAEVAPFDSSPSRAMQLAHIVDMVLAETGSAKVNIIAHSQGGLDARYLISSLHYGDRVGVLTTVATPHQGTYIADAIMGNVPGIDSAFIDAIATLFGFAYNDVRTNANIMGSLVSLSQANAATFNAQNPDDPRVIYWSWAGRSNDRTGDLECSGARFANDPTHVDDPFIALAPLATFLEQGDSVHHVNDGLVEVQSARWGYFMGCVPADHFDEIGQIAESGVNQPSGFDHLAFYRKIVQLMHEAGQ